ncbi:MAG TPA: hypothetical protein VIH37_10755 [Candidatus Limnocylindrales bacterium]
MPAVPPATGAHAEVQETGDAPANVTLNTTPRPTAPAALPTTQGASDPDPSQV